MSIAIIVTTYNRPEYLKECLESLSRSTIPTGAQVIFQDDQSTDPKVLPLLQNWNYPGIEKIVNVNPDKGGIKRSLLNAFEHAKEADLIINLDADAIVRNDWIEVLVTLHSHYPNHICTGFNCNTLNADGSIRHHIVESGPGFNIKKSVGGINMVFTPQMFNDYIRTALLEPVGNWDHRASINIGNGIVCAVPSVVQHIGLQSSMGHSGAGREAADTASDFKDLHLPNVTLIGVDSNYERLKTAFDLSTAHIQFADVKLLHNPAISSKQAYSLFCIRELAKHVTTDYMLVIQWDGYVLNWKTWNPEWLKWDYIGAPWEWYTDGMQVGNGGFSLRSRRLMEVCAQESCFNAVYHPEDDAICRQRRKYLEVQHNIKFAPVEVARTFSIEGYRSLNKTWTKEFGFHGTAVDISDPKEANLACILQYFGIGDIIFSMQIANELIDQGYKVLWPVKAEYVESLNKAYPNVTFVDYKRFSVNYDMKADRIEGGMRVIPLRWTYDIQKVEFKHCMRSKYDFMGMDWETWRNAEFKRDLDKEARLFRELGLTFGEPYTLINETFCTDSTGKRPIQAEGKTVLMKERSGYSLFDWCTVIEKAAAIHTVSTSIIYLMEMLELRAEKVYIYIRKPNENSHENYDYLMTRNREKYVFETP